MPTKIFSIDDMPLAKAKSWQPFLHAEFGKQYMLDLKNFLQQKDADCIYPPANRWFYALEAAPLHRVKVVIIGQDPYHQANQAHGLCFSVPRGAKIPPSLRNIYQELQADLNIPPAKHGCLECWAKQGVLLLNSVLTVQQGSANSHRGEGWEQFTDRVIQTVALQNKQVVFLLWGNAAQNKAKCIACKGHQILSAPHPSPLSAHRGFFGCGHFGAANRYLAQCGKETINWAVI